MLTISFYSYKGGAGRTLSVYYIAKYLSGIGKKVVVADFDFEAPGVPYKFHKKNEEIWSEGMVDFAHAYYKTGYLPEHVTPFSYTHQIAEGPKAIPVRIIPAGKIFQPSYWEKLSEIDWKIMLYGNPLEKGKPAYGSLFFLEWKERVRDELEPDVLLIDSRTGINDLTSVTLNLLADQVIVLGAHNRENLDGSRLIMEALRKAEKLEFKEKPKVHFVLTRLPKPSPEFSEEEERMLVEKAKERLNKDSGIVSGELVNKVLVVHSDDRLLIDEGRLTSDPRERLWDIELDYHQLMGDVFSKTTLLNEEEILEITVQSLKANWIGMLERANSFPEKFEILDNVIREIPSDAPDAHWVKGLLFQEVKETNRAIAEFDKAINLDEQFSEAYSSKGTLLIADGRFEAALEVLSLGMKWAPADPMMLNNMGICLLETGDLEGASDAFQTAESLDPTSDVPLCNQALVALKRSDFEKAAELSDKALLINPLSSLAYLNKGVGFLSNGKIKEAIAEFESSLALDPQFTLAEYNLGIVHALDENYKGAITIFRKITKREPWNGGAYFQLGNALYNSGMYKSAISAYGKVLRIENKNNFVGRARGLFPTQMANLNLPSAATLDDSPDGIQFQAYVHQHFIWNLGIPKSAIGDEEKLKLKPFSAWASLNLSMLYERVADKKKAALSLENAVHEGISKEFAQYSKGLVLAELGRVGEAVAAFDVSIGCDNNNLLYFKSKLQLLIKAKRYSEVLEMIEDAPEMLLVENPKILLVAAEVAAKLKKRQDFYYFLERGFKYGAVASSIPHKSIKKYISDPLFRELLQKYGQEMDQNE